MELNEIAMTMKNANKVELYISKSDFVSIRAKSLFDSMGIQYTEIYVAGNEADGKGMINCAQSNNSMPQIMVDDALVGDFCDVFNLKQSGQLDALLVSA